MDNITSILNNENDTLALSIGKAITLLWLELQNSISKSAQMRNESRKRFLSGKITGLRFALSLIKHNEAKLQIVSSQIIFASKLLHEEIHSCATTLRLMLKKDFEVLNEGGKEGMMKEWLEGHIHVIGLALSMIQPFISNSIIEQNITTQVFVNANCINKYLNQINLQSKDYKSKARTKALVLSNW